LILYGNIPRMRQKMKQGYIKNWKSITWKSRHLFRILLLICFWNF